MAAAVDPTALVLDARVTPSPAFPPRVVVELELASGQHVLCALRPEHAHLLSDELLRAVAKIVPRRSVG